MQADIPFPWSIWETGMLFDPSGMSVTVETVPRPRGNFGHSTSMMLF